ncbi:MAG TPA: hypothetical protein VHU88_17150 [Sporichthyaceae bacterium]|jgi:hypothetical protein|nr:hypothetical protein [Sporichthyaceae bacterium]
MGAATGVLAIAFSASPVISNPCLPLALLALRLSVAARREARPRRRCSGALAVAGLSMSAIAAAIVVGIHA